ncbi:MAG: hypothetical protein AB7O92_21980 [Acidimicrobiia bacterium]
MTGPFPPPPNGPGGWPPAPPPGGPPVGGPPPGWPPTGPVPGAPPPPPGGWSQPPAPKGRTGLVVAAVSVLGLVLLAGGALVAWRLLGGGDDVDSSATLAVLDQLDRDIELDDTRYAYLGDRCQLIDLDGVLDLLPAGADGDTDEAELSQYAVVQGNLVDPVVYGCSEGFERFVGFTFGHAPDGGHRQYLQRTVADFGTITVEGEAAVRGGTLYWFCVETDDYRSCGADWSDGQVQLSLYGSELDADEAAEWMRAALTDLLEQTGELDPDRIRVEEF